MNCHNNINNLSHEQAYKEEESNYCRNPDNSANGPWCFYGMNATEREPCDIPTQSILEEVELYPAMVKGQNVTASFIDAQLALKMSRTSSIVTFDLDKAIMLQRMRFRCSADSFDGPVDVSIVGEEKRCGHDGNKRQIMSKRVIDSCAEIGQMDIDNFRKYPCYHFIFHSRDNSENKNPFHQWENVELFHLNFPFTSSKDMTPYKFSRLKVEEQAQFLKGVEDMDNKFLRGNLVDQDAIFSQDKSLYNRFSRCNLTCEARKADILRSITKISKHQLARHLTTLWSKKDNDHVDNGEVDLHRGYFRLWEMQKHLDHERHLRSYVKRNERKNSELRRWSRIRRNGEVEKRRKGKGKGRKKGRMEKREEKEKRERDEREKRFEDERRWRHRHVKIINEMPFRKDFKDILGKYLDNGGLTLSAAVKKARKEWERELPKFDKKVLHALENPDQNEAILLIKRWMRKERLWRTLVRTSSPQLLTGMMNVADTIKMGLASWDISNSYERAASIASISSAVASIFEKVLEAGPTAVFARSIFDVANSLLGRKN